MMNNCAATIGFFDGVHRGHLCLLKQLEAVAAAHGLLPKVITFDRHPQEVVRPGFQPSLLTTTTEKAALLRSAFSGEVTVLPFTPALSLLPAPAFMHDVLREQLGAEVLLMGYNHRFGHGGGSAEDYVRWGRETGIEVVKAEAFGEAAVSSSRIRKLVANGEMAEANALLGYTYFLEGVVSEGKQIGRQMGFPTANLCTAAEKLLPGCGVYAVRVTMPGSTRPGGTKPGGTEPGGTEHGGTEHGGMLCIGHRPTLEAGGNLSVEVNIFDFTGDLYGQTLRLSVVDKLRDEQTFSSLEALQRQLSCDASAARQML